MSSLAFATRSFRPLAFAPRLERRLAFVLGSVATFLWVFLIPLEFAMRVPR